MRKRTKIFEPLVGTAQKRIVILGLPPVDALDVIGPAEEFSMANQLRVPEPALVLFCAGFETELGSWPRPALSRFLQADLRVAPTPSDT